MVITGCDRTTLAHTYAFRRLTGELVWKQPGGAFESDLVHVADQVVGRRWNGDLIALSLRDGQRGWRVGPQDYTHRFREDASPAESGGIVFFGGVDGQVYAVDGSSGEVVWRRDLAACITISVVTDGFDVYVGTADNRIQRIAARDGSLLAWIETSARPFGRPALAADALLVLSGEADLVAYDRALQRVIWNRRADWTSAQPLLWRGMDFAGTRGGEVYGYRLADGSVAYSFLVDGVVRGLGAHEDVLFVGTLRGLLYACRPESR